MGRTNKTGVKWGSGNAAERERMNVYQRSYRAKQGPRYKRMQKDSDLKIRYKISIEDYERMFEAQGGVCFLCNKINEDGKLLAVDHCHTTGKIRGLLCRPCNCAIGLLKEDKVIIRKILEYI